MQERVRTSYSGRRGWYLRLGAVASLLPVCLGAGGCFTKLAKPSGAVSQALAPVIDQSAAAYRDATAVHSLRNQYEAVVAYEGKDSSYNPRNASVLLSEKDIQARLAVLAALEVYSKSLIAITQGADSPALDAAAKSAGSAATSLGNDLAPSIESVLGIAAATASTTETTVTTISAGTTTTTSSTASTAAPLISTGVGNGITTGIDALGQFLVERKIKKELPSKIEHLDPVVQALCKALEGDAQTLQGLEHRDYDRILDLQKQFVLEDTQQGVKVTPPQVRAEVMKLPVIAEQQLKADQRFSSLNDAIQKLASAHHDLAVTAQQMNVETWKQKLSDLAAVGEQLGNFYSSLPTN